MAKDKTDMWVPIYIGDYLSDTMHLTTEQHGAYFLLIMAYWKNRGPLLASRLKSIVKTSDENWSVIEEFFDTKSIPGKWQHGRIDREIAQAIRIKEVRKEAGKLGGGNPIFQKGKQNPYYTDKQKDKQTDKQTDNQKINPSPSPSPSPLPSKEKQFIQTDSNEQKNPDKKASVFEKLRELQKRFPDPRYQRQIVLFVETHIEKNPDALAYVLNSFLNCKTKIINPKLWLDKAISVQNGNFNEREFQQEHDERKKPIPINEIPGLGEVLKTMAGGGK